MSADIPNPLAPAPAQPPRTGAGRALRRAAALILAALVAWLVFRAYGQPGFLIDFVNLRLC